MQYDDDDGKKHNSDSVCMSPTRAMVMAARTRALWLILLPLASSPVSSSGPELTTILLNPGIDAPQEIKLDGVGPVDNRPSTDKLHHFVKKK